MKISRETSSDTTNEYKVKSQQVPQVPPVPAPRHRVQHQSPGPAPVPAPRRVRDVVTLGKDHGERSKDEEKLKMSQDNEQQKVGFDDFEIDPLVMNNVKKSGYSMPELFLRKIFPIIQDNQIDVMACSNTESGNTAAFLISIISKFMERNIGDHPHPEEGSRAVKPHCVVITPTRESAAQISTLAKTITEATKMRVVVTSGDTSVQQQMEDARRGCNILISTPGRLLYFVKENVISFESLEALVLDEADRLISDDFKDCVEKIVTSETMPRIKDRQTFVHCKKLNEKTRGRVKMFLDKSYLFVDDEDQ